MIIRGINGDLFSHDGVGGIQEALKWDYRSSSQPWQMLVYVGNSLGDID